MNSHRFARAGLTAVGFLIAAATLAGCGGGSSGKPTQTVDTQKKPIDPPTILSPRKNDVMGYDFAVAGTYGAANKDITVVVSGEVAGTKSMQTLPSWTLSFGTAKKDGDEDASATVTGSAPATVSFKVKGMRDFLADQNLQNVVCDPCTQLCSFDVRVTNTAAGAATITAELYNTTGGTPAHGPIDLTQVAGTQVWQGTFNNVPAGQYGVQFKRVIGTDTVTTSKMEDVK